ncbi:MAG TPA: hypothetical protein VFH90_03400 [Candidatus Limnocylindria bacterium]|nr:hypothetical protein [Candidatus Limnocylindria bacterium]
MNIAGIAAVTLIGGVILFQIGLVLGARWGSAAWGGQNQGRLPVRLRIASGAAILILAFLAWVVAARAELVAVSPMPESWLAPATWVAAGYFALGAIVNLISRSRVERLWSPVALATSICCGVVSLG